MMVGVISVHFICWPWPMYAMTDSPSTMAPPMGAGTGMIMLAPASRLLCRQGPSLRSYRRPQGTFEIITFQAESLALYLNAGTCIGCDTNRSAALPSAIKPTRTQLLWKKHHPLPHEMPGALLVHKSNETQRAVQFIKYFWSCRAHLP